MEDLSTNEMKEQLRLFLRERRRKVTKKHRKWAREDCLAELKPLLVAFPYVLSFASTDEEIDLWPVNEMLASEGRLLLPRVEGEHIAAYHVKDLKTDLKSSKWKIKEPDPKRCKLADYEEITCILVPGLGFDNCKHRLGYGKGFYDRFLVEFAHIPAFGIGFKEQLMADHFPLDPTDRRLTRLYLF